MNIDFPYNGGLTREQYLFYEIRIVAKMKIQDLNQIDIIEKIKNENLFQFPTERMINNIARVCLKRIDALDNAKLVQKLAEAPAYVAKQINLYAMMRYNRIVWEFMINVIGEKYRVQDLSFSRKDLNLFFVRLQEQNDDVAAWSEATIAKIKQVLTKSLIETDFLDNNKSVTLNTVLLCEELEQGIRENGDVEVLQAFNCFS